MLTLFRLRYFIYKKTADNCQDFNLDGFVALILPDENATGSKFMRCIAEHPEHKGYYLFSNIEMFKGGENAGGVIETSKRGLHSSAMHHVLESWDIKSMDEFLMIPKDEIDNIYSFMCIQKPDPNKNYWEQ